MGYCGELAELILKDPGREAYVHVFARWREAQDSGLFPWLYKAVIHRVFAATAPSVTPRWSRSNTAVHSLERFARDFELKTTRSDDWIELNQFIKEAMKQAGLPQDQPIDNNILAWWMYESFANEPAMTDAIDEPADSQPANDTENEDPVMNETPLNQILFGPPGTGKISITPSTRRWPFSNLPCWQSRQQRGASSRPRSITTSRRGRLPSSPFIRASAMRTLWRGYGPLPEKTGRWSTRLRPGFLPSCASKQVVA